MKKKDNQQNSGRVIMPVGHSNPPEQHELDSAMVLGGCRKKILRIMSDIPNICVEKA